MLARLTTNNIFNKQSFAKSNLTYNLKVLFNLKYFKILVLELGTLRIEISRLSLNVNKSQFNNVVIFNNISKLVKDKEIIDNSKSDTKEELIINKGILSRTKKSTSKKRINIDI
jgi:hypothetical protein